MNSYFVKSYNYWKANLIVILLSAITLVYMEWLFIATKPSFLTAAALQEKILVLFISSALVIGVLLLLSFPFVIYCSLFPSSVKNNSYLLSIIPAIVLVVSSIFRTFRNHLVVVPPDVACSSTFSVPRVSLACTSAWHTLTSTQTDRLGTRRPSWFCA